MDIMKLLEDFKNLIVLLLSNFTYVKDILAGVLNDLNNYDFVTYITPGAGTIRYLAGNRIYYMLTSMVIVALFVGTVKAFNFILKQIMGSNILRKPWNALKTLIGK